MNDTMKNNNMQPIIEWTANKIHTRRDSQALAIEIHLLRKKTSQVWGLLKVLGNMIEVDSVTIVDKAVNYYCNNYELPEIHRADNDFDWGLHSKLWDVLNKEFPQYTALEERTEENMREMASMLQFIAGNLIDEVTDNRINN